VNHELGGIDRLACELDEMRMVGEEEHLHPA
jgi:hypothetical protein